MNQHTQNPFQSQNSYEDLLTGDVNDTHNYMKSRSDTTDTSSTTDTNESRLSSDSVSNHGYYGGASYRVKKLKKNMMKKKKSINEHLPQMPNMHMAEKLPKFRRMSFRKKKNLEESLDDLGLGERLYDDEE